jgi:hypothetical protein
MANTIAYAKAYLNMLDGIYKLGASTSGLEALPGMFKTSDIAANSIYVKKVTANGLGDYSRASGYVAGDSTISWEEHTFAFDRGRKYNLDAMDAVEAMTQAGELAAEIYRTQVVPEIDAYRFKKICSLCGLDASTNLTYDTAITALDTAIATLDDAEVPQEGRILYVSNEMYKLMKQSGEFFNVRTGSIQVMDRTIESFDGMPINRVPGARFKTACTFNDGTSGGQEVGGFVAGGKDINFMIVYKPVALGIVKHVAPKLIAPEANPTGDGWIFGFRVYHDLFIMDNKVNGVYVHTKA